MKKKYNVLLLAGGDSPERDVSMLSAKSIHEALEELGHRIVVADPQKPDRSPEEARDLVLHSVIESTPPAQVDRDGRFGFVQILDKWKSSGLDMVFNALHGGAGEDGTIQAILEYFGIPFTGSGSSACMLAMDKRLSRRLVDAAGVPLPEGFIMDKSEASVDALEERIAAGPGFPAIIKPANQGSSVGFSIVRSSTDIQGAVDKAGAFGSAFVVERYIAGTEMTVSVLGSAALPVLEIRPKSGVYDYEHKYTAGASEYMVPAPIESKLAEAFAGHAVSAFQALGCCVYGRVDFRLSGEGKPFFLEVNTLPGMTSNSLVPKSAQAAGIEFPELVERIMRLSLQEDRSAH